MRVERLDAPRGPTGTLSISVFLDSYLGRFQADLDDRTCALKSHGPLYESGFSSRSSSSFNRLDRAQTCNFQIPNILSRDAAR